MSKKESSIVDVCEQIVTSLERSIFNDVYTLLLSCSDILRFIAKHDHVLKRIAGNKQYWEGEFEERMELSVGERPCADENI